MCPHLAAVPAGHHELLAGAARGEVRVDARRVEEAPLTGGMVTGPMVIVMLFTVSKLTTLIMMLFCHVFAEFMNQEN